jgi:hypothetical protein
MNSIGDDRARTGNLRLAKPALSQLSYVPGLPLCGYLKFEISDLKLSVGPGRFELPTSRLSGVRSNQLSYEPVAISISDYSLTILIKKSQIGNRKPTILPGSSVITIYLKKSNKKTAARNCQRPKIRTLTIVRQQFRAK